MSARCQCSLTAKIPTNCNRQIWHGSSVSTILLNNSAMGEFGLTTRIASLRASHHGVKCTMPLTWRTCRVGKSPLADWGLQTSALFNPHYGNKSQMKNVYSFALKVIMPGNILQSVSKVEYTCNCFTNITPKQGSPYQLDYLIALTETSKNNKLRI